MQKPAVLALEDGSIFHGVAVGAEGSTVGEVVFNTAMTGYQEILTDPSYTQQIITFTYPHIGNTGVNRDDNESAKVWAAGCVMRDLSIIPSNWRSHQTLDEFLKQQNVIGIADIDTRRLTRILRDKGAQRGCISTEVDDIETIIAKAKAFPGLENADLAKQVTTDKMYEWTEGTWQLNPKDSETIAPKFHVVAYDYGIKQNILRLLIDRACKVTVVPAQTPAAKVLAMQPDGIFVSNGPGDPAACNYAIESIGEFIKQGVPLFGICLGFQLLALAVGGKTKKMKFGHHGANHPVGDLRNNHVLVTSQNHGFCVVEESLPDTIEITHRSLFDNTIQGICHKEKPALGFQGHPEASPGST